VVIEWSLSAYTLTYIACLVWTIEVQWSAQYAVTFPVSITDRSFHNGLNIQTVLFVIHAACAMPTFLAAVLLT